MLRVKLQGGNRTVEEFDVYGPKAIAGIGDLPDTVADRAIPIRLKRRASREPIAKFRRRWAEAEAAAIVMEWSEVAVPAEARVPDALDDRAADSWEPLMAVAIAAGGRWPGRAWRAAAALSSESEAAVSVGVRLLADIHRVFDGVEHLTTGALLGRLYRLEEAPWADWYGSPLTARALARLLAPYRVGPTQRRVGGEKSRGYFRADFEDLWSRYVISSATGTNGANGTSRTAAPDVPDVPVPQGASARRSTARCNDSE